MMGVMRKLLLCAIALAVSSASEWRSFAQDKHAAVADTLRETLPWEEPHSGLVGNAGDPANIEFSGNVAFPAQTLRDALMDSPGYLLGAHHRARREAFLAMVQRKMLLGYKFNGFPEPRVSVSYDEAQGRTRVRIVEGKRFECGAVRVSGVSPAVAEVLTNRLTRPPLPPLEIENQFNKGGQTANSGGPDSSEGSGLKAQLHLNVAPADQEHPLSTKHTRPENRFLWEPGHPAGFCDAALNDLESETKDVLAERGFFFPKVNLRTELVPASGRADLVVEVTELGPPGELSSIEISGNETNSESELRQFLGFKPGMLMTRARLEEAEQKLWQSGRFRYYELKPEADPGAGAASNQVRLLVKVVEFPFAPKLTAPLSERQKALVQLCNWLADFAARPDEDAIISLKPKDLPVNLDLEFTLSPRQGTLVQFRDADFARNGYAYSCLMTTNTLGLFAPQRGSKLLAVNTNLLAEAFVRLVPNPPDSEQRFSLTVGAGWHYLPASQAKNLPPSRLDLTLAPAAFLSFAEELGDECKIEGNTCSIVTSNAVLKFDTATGRLGELRYGDEPVRASLRFVTNGFDRGVSSLQQASATLTNRYIAGHPLGSFLAFAGGELARLELLDQVTTNLTAAEREQAVAALCRLLDPVVFKPLDEGLTRPEEPEDRTFSIPPDEAEAAASQNNLFGQCAGVLFRHCNEWFPKYSWPWTMARESVLVLANQGTYTETELTRILGSDSTGPVGRLAVAAALSRLGFPSAKAFAASGLTRLAAADFRTDCRLLLEGHSGLAKAVANLAEALRTMPPEQLAALEKALPPPEAALVQECARALRAQPKDPLMTSLAPALDHYWEQILRGRVRSKLLELANRSSRTL
jgi:hypothetical protein